MKWNNFSSTFILLWDIQHFLYGATTSFLYDSQCWIELNGSNLCAIASEVCAICGSEKYSRKFLQKIGIFEEELFQIFVVFSKNNYYSKFLDF